MEQNYKEQFEQLLSNLKSITSAKQVRGSFGSFCPNLQFITLDALDAKDYPHGIAQNSTFLTFAINLDTMKVELHSNGHCYLSEDDQKSDRWKYFAMRSITEIAATDYGTKKFRKSKVKSMADAACKMENYYLKVMDAMKQYTDGYPYHYGKKSSAA